MVTSKLHSKECIQKLKFFKAQKNQRVNKKTKRRAA